MSRVIKSNPTDPKLSRALARLSLANSMLLDSLKQDNGENVKSAIAVVRDSVVGANKLFRQVPESVENSTAIAYGITLMCESDILCNKGAEKLRTLFRSIKGGKNE